MDKKIVLSSFLITILLSGCGAICPGYTQNGTRNMDGFCGDMYRRGVLDPNAIPYGASTAQSQAPAYDPFRAPTIVNTGPGTTSGNTNYNLNGSYNGQLQQQNRTVNCTTQYYGGVANTTCR